MANPPWFMRKFWFNSGLSVVLMVIIATTNGYMLIWPLFGATNQLLAALALLVVTLYLKGKGGRKFVVTAVPCFIMLVITNWAMVGNEMLFVRDENWLLVTIGAAIFGLALWMTYQPRPLAQRPSLLLIPRPDARDCTRRFLEHRGTWRRPRG